MHLNVYISTAIFGTQIVLSQLMSTTLFHVKKQFITFYYILVTLHLNGSYEYSVKDSGGEY